MKRTIPSLHCCVGHTAWAPEGRDGHYQAGPKGCNLEVGARRAPRLLSTINGLESKLWMHGKPRPIKLREIWEMRIWGSTRLKTTSPLIKSSPFCAQIVTRTNSNMHPLTNTRQPTCNVWNVKILKWDGWDGSDYGSILHNSMYAGKIVGQTCNF